MTLESQSKPTIYDVALAAGVSHQTVSRVLNRPETVRPTNRHRVLAAIASLGYERNAGAAQLGRLHKNRDAAGEAAGPHERPTHRAR